MNFVKEFKALLSSILAMIVAKKSEIEINLFINDMVPKFYNQFFANNMIVNTQTVQKELVTLSNFYKVPFKFNKDLFNAISGNSLFSSDTSWTNAYTKKEINRLKSVVAKSLYEGKTEAELRAILTQDLKYNARAAQLIARTERNRCLNTAVSMYYNQLDPNKYVKVWHTNMDGHERPEHASMNGKQADQWGYFQTTWGESMSEPGSGSNVKMNINCRCRSEIVEK